MSDPALIWSYLAEGPLLWLFATLVAYLAGDGSGLDLGRLRERVLKLQQHFGQANEDVRQILISADKIEKRAARIEDLDFDKADEVAPVTSSKRPELYTAPIRKLQAGE